MVKQETGKVNIHGKEYLTVALRINMFREKYGDKLTIKTKIVDATPNRVVMKAIIKQGSVVLATGHAEEVRGTSNINATSALENAETSAIGRALAVMGLGGTEFASANEVEQAIHQQQQPYTPDQKLVFDELIEKEDALDLHIFLQGLSDDAKVGLHNSFERGTITAMKKKVRELEKFGAEAMQEYYTGIDLAITEEDAGQLRELWDELGKQGAAIVWRNATAETRSKIKSMLEV